MNDLTKVAHFSPLEIKAREVLSAVAGEDASTTDMVVVGVFRAMWSAALPCSRVEKIGAAMYGLEGIDLQKALTRLVRRGVLRSRRERGELLYEVAI